MGNNKFTSAFSALEISDVNKRNAAYLAVGFVISNMIYTKMGTGTGEYTYLDMKLCVKKITGWINEQAIVDYDVLYKTIMRMVDMKIRLVSNDISFVGSMKTTDISGLDILGVSDFITESDMKDIVDNIMLYKNIVYVTKVWYDNRFVIEE